jgi:GH25 family lysozyme M1 (1,4-beta-N-acetylmuramidase)
MTAEIKGIDISDYQRGLAIASLRSQGISFVILKVGEGRTLADASFDAFYDAAIRSGLAVGAYFYSYAVTPEEGERDAKRALSLIRGRSLPLGVYIDVEDAGQLALRDSALTSVVKSFCDTIRAAGYRAGAYGSDLGLWAKVGPSFLGNDVLVWSACWGGKPHVNCDVWQTSDKGRVSGYNGNVDTDKCMSARFAALVNGEAQDEPQPAPDPAPAPEPSPSPTFCLEGVPALRIGDTGNAVKALQGELIASGYRCGGKRKWCCGSETPDGIFGPVTAESVRSFQRAHNLSESGVADKETRSALLGEIV